jgi:hypothetical protein
MSTVIAEVLSSNSPVELGLVVTLIVATSAWAAQALLGRHRTEQLEKGLVKSDESNTKAAAALETKISNLERSQREDHAECLDRFTELQREVDRLTGSLPASRSGVRKKRADG